jgi:tetratricopeptide (TPR) repeat protein
MRRLPAVVLALLALAGAARADQSDSRLPGLFAALRAAPGAPEARAIEAAIWTVWLETEDDDARLLLNQGLVELARGEHARALAAFDGVVERAPGFAEGWNKRATVLFLLSDFQASVADIERTLALEPRHFGALSGLGQIYRALGNDALALKAFEAALEIHPHLIGVRAAVEELRRSRAGKPT